MRCSRIVLPALLIVATVRGGFAQLVDRITSPVDASHRTALTHHVSSRLATAQDLGETDPNLRIDSVVLLLKPSAEQHQALEKLLADLQNPSSPNYHHWLTPAEYADRFGLTTTDFEKTRSWLESQGLQIDQVANARNWIMFSGTHGQVSKAFHTTIHSFQTDGSIHFANTSDPEIPIALSAVVAGIHGLTDFHPRAANRQSSKPRYSDPNRPAFYLAPGDVATAYNIKPLYAAGYQGSGVSIAVVGQSDFTMSDITAYRSFFSLPANQPQIILAGADPGTASQDDVFEAELDLELAGGVAPNAAIKFVNSRDVMTSALYAIDHKVAPIITMSYGSCEAEATVNLDTWRSYIQQANATGITFLASSGDAGPAACDWNPSSPETEAIHGLAVNFPASIPEVTAVGGTTISANFASQNAADKSDLTSVIQETAWNYSVGVTFAATGGGPSQHFSKPAWQALPGVPADGQRDLPDIALSASANDGYLPYAICFNGSCQSGNVVAAGGTSASSPVAAAILAVLQQYAIAKGTSSSGGFGNINPRLYQLSQSSPAAFNDVRNGSGTIRCQIGTPNCTTGSFGYSAGPGYDLATGLGSINANELAKAWGLSANRAAVTVAVSSNAPECTPPNANISVRISPASGSATPTGSVYLYASSIYSSTFYSFLGTAPLTGTGANSTATLAVPSASVLAGSVYAVYTGDNNLAGAVSPVQSVSLNTYGTFTLTANSPSVLQGTPVQLTANIQLFCSAASSPITLNNLSAIPDANGNATFNFGNLPVGSSGYLAYYTDPAHGNLVASNLVSVEVADPAAPEYSVSIFAGTGVAGISGDGGPATSAQLKATSGIAVDSKGNVYISDSAASSIRKVDKSGIMSTFASQLSSPPYNLAVGSDGALYAGVAGAVIKIVAGTVTPFAGVGQCNTYSGEGGPAVHAQICPNSLAADGLGNIFIADTSNARIYKISTNGIISTVAGNGTATVNDPTVLDGSNAVSVSVVPTAIAADAQGDLFLSNTGIQYSTSAAVYEIKNDGILHIIPALNYVAAPVGMAVGPAGELFIVKGPYSYSNQIFRYFAGNLSTIAGTNSFPAPQSTQNALIAQVLWPGAIAVDSSGTMYLPAGFEPIVQTVQPYSNFLNTPLRFVPVTPCRVADTRLNTTLFGSALPAQTSRDFLVPQSSCNIPAAAQCSEPQS